ncbi:MAG TPA: S41 family peptidase [Anaerolineae bacterium]|nr:S41 family peptidase [Anaerolineae bacterium]
MQSKIDRFSIFLAVMVAFIMGYWFGQTSWAPIRLTNVNGATAETTREAFEPFWEVWELVNNRFYDQPLATDRLVDGAIRGVLAELDDQPTSYRSPEEQARFVADMSGEFQGIGAQVTDEEGDITVVTPLTGSPAEAAGILPGDIIREVDGVDVAGMTLSEAVTLVRGPADTEVILTIERKGTLLDVSITRGVIKVSNVTSEMLANGIAYLKLNQFGDEETVNDFNSHLEALMVEEPIGLILDLRRNPGGLLTTAVDIGDQFLPEGDFLYQRYGDGTETVYETSEEGIAEDIPLVVLLDEGSASASEVLANAFRDYGRATLIGQTTFGKGTIQSAYTLDNGGGVSITVARWLSPERNWVQDSGLDPDYFIPLADYGHINDPELDTQLQAGVDFLLGKEIESVPPAEDDDEDVGEGE